MISALLFYAFTLHAEQIPMQKVWHSCQKAGKKYNVDPYMLLSIAEVESNFDASAITRNKNGTVDIGIMQINECWFSQLKKHTPNPRKSLLSYEYNIDIGAWVLAQCISRFGDSWKAVDCYNKGTRDPRENSYYNHKVWKKYKQYRHF